LHIAEEASAEQRDTLVRMLSGQAQGNGPFALFAVVEEPVFTKVEIHIDGRNSWFKVDGIIYTELDAFIDPVSGAVRDIQIHKR
jgi:hypothetical protein